MRRRQRREIGVLARLALLLIVILMVAAAAIMGPTRALRIGIAGATHRLFDRPIDPSDHRIPVLDVHIDQAHLDALQSDLPWSGGVRKPAILKQHGIEHEVGFRYRGVMATTHFLGEKRSFRLNMKRSDPFSPIRKVNVINPKAMNMLNDHLAIWVAGYMGVPVPYNEMVFVRLNDRDLGVMELFEQIDGDFARIRGLSEEKIPVFKGDFPPVLGRETPPHLPLWRDREHWEYASVADSSFADQRLRELISIVNTDPSRIPDSSFFDPVDSLAKLIDIPLFLNYFAALKVINTKHIDNYHNQWLVMEDGSAQFHPIMWDPLMMFPPAGEPWYPIHDALSYRILSVPAWRLARDRKIYQALKELRDDGAFTAYAKELFERVRPSIMADPNKFGVLTDLPEDVHQFSSLHAAGSFDKLIAQVLAYWDRCKAMSTPGDLKAASGFGQVQASWSGPGALRVMFGPVTGTPPLVVDGTDTLKIEHHQGRWSVDIIPQVLQRGEGELSPFSDRTWFEVLPTDVDLRITGYAERPELINAVTDEAITR